jgi:hypothetical protein
VNAPAPHLSLWCRLGLHALCCVALECSPAGGFEMVFRCERRGCGYRERWTGDPWEHETSRLSDATPPGDG